MRICAGAMLVFVFVTATPTLAWESQTHEALTRAAAAEIAASPQDVQKMVAGNLWADSQWGSVPLTLDGITFEVTLASTRHLYDPDTGDSVLLIVDAASLAARYEAWALYWKAVWQTTPWPSWRAYARGQFFFFLGAVLHLIQDSSNTAHSNPNVLEALIVEALVTRNPSAVLPWAEIHGSSEAFGEAFILASGVPSFSPIQLDSPARSYVHATAENSKPNYGPDLGWVINGLQSAAAYGTGYAIEATKLDEQ
jgi:hypothetical protein